MYLTTEQLQETFQLFDIRGKGYVSAKEMRFLLRGIGYQELSAEELGAMIKVMDVQCNGTIALKEFLRFVERKRTERSAVEDTWRCFRLFSEDRGHITARDVQRVLEQNEPLPPRAAERIRRFTGVGDASNMSYDQWKKVIAAVDADTAVL